MRISRERISSFFSFFGIGLVGHGHAVWEPSNVLLDERSFFSSLFAFRDTQTNGGLFRSDSYMILPSLLPDCLDLMLSLNYCHGACSLDFSCICIRRLFTTSGVFQMQSRNSAS
ncbi:hypothetical protein HDV62DRAFT_20858 [Trichoderma sp. SZMC 28011]